MMTGVPAVTGQGFVKGHPGELLRATALLRPVPSQVSDLAAGVAARGRQAADAAGSAEVAATLTTLAGTLAKALGDTGTVVGHLGEVTELSAANLDQAATR